MTAPELCPLCGCARSFPAGRRRDEPGGGEDLHLCPHGQECDGRGGCQDCDWAAALVESEEPQAAPESYCHRCNGPNSSWEAPSPLWNRVMRGGSIDGPWHYDEIICVRCFIELAEAAGIADGWRLTATSVHVPLETTTPTGRVWDEGAFRWGAALVEAGEPA